MEVTLQSVRDKLCRQPRVRSGGSGLAFGWSDPDHPFKTLHPLCECGAFLGHVVVAVIVARLDTAQDVRRNLCAHVARNSESGHVRLRMPRFLSQGHATGRARAHRNPRLVDSAADYWRQIIEDGQEMPARVGMSVAPLWVQQCDGGTRDVDALHRCAKQLRRPLSTEIQTGDHSVPSRAVVAPSRRRGNAKLRSARARSMPDPTS